MTSLATLLADPTALIRRVSVKAPEPAAIRREAAKIEGAATTVRNPEMTAVLQARVAALVNAGDVEAVTRRDLRDSCRTFLHAPYPPGEDDFIGRAIVDRVRRTGRRPAFFALLDAYLDGFKTGDATVKALATTLRSCSDGWAWRPGDPWRDRLLAFDLLDPDLAPARIAHAVLASARGPRPVLQAAGLDLGARPRGGMSEAAFVEACRLTCRLQGEAAKVAQTMLLRWAQQQPGTTSFPRAWPELVSACLLPWRKSDPDAAHKAFLIDELELLGGGDPRTAGGGRWPAVEKTAPDAYSVLLRWLTRASVMQFLEIVDRSLREPDARRMWSYRRAFWTSYLLADQGPAIEQAWVAFGSDGAKLARAAARESKDKSLSVFGIQNEKSSQHAALIVRIGDLLIVDWSHSGKYNVWRKGEGGPELFRPSYAAGSLDSAPLRDSHSAPSHYNWQKSLAYIIEGRRFMNEKPAWRPRGV
ncbi:hypothetical protein EJC47_11305 [Sphingomonas sp. TF3]|uniref:EH signature domain-containing protein n=1 Tax=Sphingomonas sp. TF3 TaxID=2495580 RepID=UPI000F874E16|nr:EH signature domain-containing protein [Sphingomonas sp. TF3]RUN76548.1 hypothetical protein EJC47_11305 [Sphingomonas sp. TF3]